jgi:AbiV family abortive infection protein
MRKTEGITKYKLVKLATESLKNSLRLHFDSVLLFNSGSFASAFQLSVLSLEEFAKGKWVEHYVWTSETNDGYPDREFEQEWLKLLYRHPEKQWAFIAREVFVYSPKFADFIKAKRLEERKQAATYVGLSRVGGVVNVRSRLSTPTRIKRREAAQMISLLNSEFLEVSERIRTGDGYFDITDMDDVFGDDTHVELAKWPYRSGLKSRRWSKVWFHR